MSIMHLSTAKFADYKCKSGTQVKIKTIINVLFSLRKFVFDIRLNTQQGNLFHMMSIYFDFLFFNQSKRELVTDNYQKPAIRI